MNISATSANSAQPTVAPASSASTSSKPAAAKTPASGSDQVNLSSAALASRQEATETTAQTSREAQGGDHQAQRLLAKESHASAPQVKA